MAFVPKGIRTIGLSSDVIYILLGLTPVSILNAPVDYVDEL